MEKPKFHLNLNIKEPNISNKGKRISSRISYLLKTIIPSSLISPRDNIVTTEKFMSEMKSNMVPFSVNSSY